MFLVILYVTIQVGDNMKYYTHINNIMNDMIDDVSYIGRKSVVGLVNNIDK